MLSSSENTPGSLPEPCRSSILLQLYVRVWFPSAVHCAELELARVQLTSRDRSVVTTSGSPEPLKERELPGERRVEIWHNQSGLVVSLFSRVLPTDAASEVANEPDSFFYPRRLHDSNMYLAFYPRRRIDYRPWLSPR